MIKPVIRLVLISFHTFGSETYTPTLVCLAHTAVNVVYINYMETEYVL